MWCPFGAVLGTVLGAILGAVLTCFSTSTVDIAAATDLRSQLLSTCAVGYARALEHHPPTVVQQMRDYQALSGSRWAGLLCLHACLLARRVYIANSARWAQQ